MQIEVKRFGMVTGPGSPKALRFGATVPTCDVHTFFGLEGRRLFPASLLRVLHV